MTSTPPPLPGPPDRDRPRLPTQRATGDGGSGRQQAMGCFRVVVVVSAVIAAIVLSVLAVAVAWGGSGLIASVAGGNRIVSCIGGAVTGLVAAALTVMVGTVPTIMLGQKETEGRVSPLGAIFVGVALPLLAVFAKPEELLIAAIGAPLLGAGLFYFQEPAAAAFWCGIATPLVGVANGFLISADVFGTDEGGGGDWDD